MRDGGGGGAAGLRPRGAVPRSGRVGPGAVAGLWVGSERPGSFSRGVEGVAAVRSQLRSSAGGGGRRGVSVWCPGAEATGPAP